MKVTIHTPIAHCKGIYDLNTLYAMELDSDIIFTDKAEMLAYIGLTLENLNKIYTGVKGEVLKQLVKADWKQESLTSSNLISPNLIEITEDMKKYIEHFELHTEQS
jgi:hypothetical protein